MKLAYNQTTEGRYTGSGHVRGYCGLVNTAKPISEYIPECEYFIEPFAGLGRISKQVKAKIKVLNDLGDFACKHNIVSFPNAVITQEDFITCVKRWDGKDRVMFFDPPWSKAEYEKGCHGRAVITMTPKQYYEKLFELLPILKSDWFVAGNKKNTMLLKSKYYQKMFESEKAKIMGGKIKTLVISNKPFVRYHQASLDVHDTGVNH